MQRKPAPTLHELLAAHATGGAEQNAGHRVQSGNAASGATAYSVGTGEAQSTFRSVDVDLSDVDAGLDSREDRSPATAAMLPHELRKMHETVTATYALLADIGASMQKNFGEIREIRSHVEPQSYAAASSTTHDTGFDKILAQIQANQTVQQLRLDEILHRVEQNDEDGRENADKIFQALASLATGKREQMRLMTQSSFDSAPLVRLNSEATVAEEPHPTMVKHRQEEASAKEAKEEVHMKSMALATNREKVQRHIAKYAVDNTEAQHVSKLRNSDLVRTFPILRSIVDFLFGRPQADAVAKERKEDDRAARRATSLCFWIVEGPLAQITLAVILLNAFWIGMVTDLKMKKFKTGKDPGVKWHDHIDLSFVVFFTVELLWRIAVHGLDFILGDDRMVNLFDTFVVLVTWPKHLGGEFGAASSLFGLFRLLRLLRLLKIVRHIRFATEFRLLLLTIVTSMRTMIWCFAIFLFWTFMMSVALMQVFISGADRNREDHQDLMKRYFSSVGKSMLTLVEASTTGVLWGDLGREIYRVLGLARILLYAYVLPVIFCLLPIVIGLYAMEVNDCKLGDADIAQNRRHKEAKEFYDELRRRLAEVGFRSDYNLNKSELEALMNNLDLDNYLDTNGIQASAGELIDLFDADNDSALTVDEFSIGCQWLKMYGGSCDVLFLGEQVAMLHNSVAASNSRAEVQREELRETVARLEAALRKNTRSRASPSSSSGFRSNNITPP